MSRPSFFAGSYLQQQGYRIVPVTPAYAEVLGQKAYASLRDIPFAVDMVDIFRKTDDVLPVARDAIAIGDATRPYVTVLVSIDPEIVGRFAESRGLAWSTFADLSQHPVVQDLLRETVQSINRQLDPHAQAVAFASFPKELDADDEELTRSRKLRRDVIEQRYAVLIDALYAGSDRCEIDVLVRYRDGTQGRVQQQVRVSRVRE